MQKDNSFVIALLAITTVIIFLFVSFIFVILWLYKKKQIKNKKDLQIMNLNYEKASLAMQLQIQEYTFQKISQEIHDNICLTLALSKLNLNTLIIPNEIEIRAIVDDSVDLISKALADLNDISKSMDSELIKVHGLIHALESEIDLLYRSGKFETEFLVNGDIIFLEADKELTIFRIVQESLNNIIKHSFASKISVIVNYSKDSISLFIEDNGVGFDLNSVKSKSLRKSGLGLTNIRNRAKMIDALVDIVSEPKIGTRINLILPLQKDILINGTKN